MSTRRSRTIRRVFASAKQRQGFALPLAILVIAALTATLAAAFSSVTAEIATNSAQRSESRAFAMAESGLEEYLARRTYHCTARSGYAPSCGTPPLVDVESVTVSLEGGYAVVVARRVRRAVGTTVPATYLVRSRGIDTIAPFNGATRTVFGERIVAQYVIWNSKSIQVLSGWTSLTGLNKNGNSGSLTGVDRCSAASGGGAPPVAGVSVPTIPGYTGPDRTSGSPGISTLGSQATANAAVKIDWNGIVNGGAVTADYTFTVGSAAPAALVAVWADPTQYPVVHVTGNGTYTINDGRGLLIIDGGATMSGNTTWDGIIMAGGNMTSNGNNTVNGAILTGLNMKLTLPQLAAAGFGSTYPLGGDTGNGTKNMSYDSCEVSKAASRFGTFKVIPNAWMDNYTTY
jgi:hypothetical protein